MKKSTKTIALLTALVLVTACFIGGTIARYVTSTSSEDEARVAVWGINAVGPTEMDLFNATYTAEDGTIVAQSNNGTDKIIAPGTHKDNQFSIVNTDANLNPEVMYEIRISLDDSEIDQRILDNPSIQWRLDNGAYGTWEETKAKILVLSGHESGVKTYAPGDAEHEFKSGKTHTIGWQWLMNNGTDELDTAMGNAIANGDIIKATIKVSVTAKQVDVDTTGLLDGNGQTFDLNNPTPLTFRSSAPVEELQSVTVNDGETTTTLVEDDDYTVESGSTIITLSEDYLSDLEVGNYTISIVSKNITVKASFSITEGEIIPSETLSENSWETISKVAKTGKASDYWSVGDKTTVDINGTDYEVVIADFDVDGDNTITFAFTQQINSNSTIINDTAVSVDGWKGSKMRNETLPNILAQMENKDYIKEVEKKTIKGANDSNDCVGETTSEWGGFCDAAKDQVYNIIKTNDKLFLFSYTEVFGNQTNEGIQYEYFKNQENRIVKPTPDVNYGLLWWLRSPVSTYPNWFYLIEGDGDNSVFPANYTSSNIVPGFVIG